jgi:hypothetical protein
MVSQKKLLGLSVVPYGAVLWILNEKSVRINQL